jgi:hypothetical protein
MDTESYVFEYYKKRNWAEYIQKHHRSYLAMAWAGYHETGRGFVVLDFIQAVMDTNDAIVEIPVEYLTADELIAKKDSHPDIILNAHRVANRYDPETEMALCHIFPPSHQDSLNTVMLGINGAFPIRQIYEEEKG